MNLQDIVLHNDTTAGKVFDFFTQGLIVLSVISPVVETIQIPESVQQALQTFEIVCVSIFTLEYLLRVFATPRKIKFIFSFYGLIDLIAILPTLLATGVDLRSVRILRLLRLFRMFKLFRYGKAVDRFITAIRNIKEELVIFITLTIAVLFIASVGIYYCEHNAQPEVFASIPHSLWWAVATLTTVGYGDIYPITVGGKIFTFFILLIGLGIVAIPSGLLASALTSTKMEKI